MTLAESTGMEAFYTGISAKDRANIEKHLAAIDAEPDPAHGRLWRRLARALRGLAPMSVQTIGQHSALFFIADGKYRMQVFALEDQRDGKLLIYLPDVLAEAAKAKLISSKASTAKTLEGEAPQEFAIRGSKGGMLRIDALDSSNTPTPGPHFKHMLGWNRKALRLTILNIASSSEIEAAEALCALAAKKWAKAS